MLRLPVCICLVPEEVKEVVGTPDTGVMDSYETSCRCWDLNPDPLQEQVCLIIELSLQLLFLEFYPLVSVTSNSFLFVVTPFL